MYNSLFQLARDLTADHVLTSLEVLEKYQDDSLVKLIFFAIPSKLSALLRVPRALQIKFSLIERSYFTAGERYGNKQTKFKFAKTMVFFMHTHTAFNRKKNKRCKIVL